MTDGTLQAEIILAEEKAWVALAAYKFMMFGYWAAIWVHLNHISNSRAPNPFRRLVEIARNVTTDRADVSQIEAKQ